MGDILILEGNMEALSAADYLHRANFYNNVIIIIDEEEDDGLSKYRHEIMRNIAWLTGTVKMTDEHIEVSGEKGRLKFNPIATIITHERHLKMLMENLRIDRLKINHRLQAYEISNKIFVSPTSILKIFENDLRKKTGMILGMSVSNYISNRETIGDIYIEVLDNRLKILPNIASSTDKLFIWYSTESPLSQLVINNVGFDDVIGLKGILYIDNVGKIAGREKKLRITPVFK